MAVRHRAVAEKAGLPLASTTYYFASLDDLVTAAAERTCRDELDEVRTDLDALPPDAPRSALLELVLDQLLGLDSRSGGLDAVPLQAWVSVCVPGDDGEGVENDQCRL